jgi:tetratricopeptide (TPR) repeat protein
MPQVSWLVRSIKVYSSRYPCGLAGGTEMNNMQINLIENLETFKEIRKNWDVVYEADPQAQFFLSWVWLSGWLKMWQEPWFILAAKPSPHASSYVAFFPLKFRVVRQDGGPLYTQLCMAGNSIADYTGLISLPEYEQEAIPAFAAYLKQQLTWSIFHLKNFLETDTRMSLFLRSFSGESFEFEQSFEENNQDGIDNYTCPYVPLAEDWERYLQTALGSNTRQKIRRFLRKIEGSNEFQITHVNADNLERHIEILLSLWHSKWESKKGSNCGIIMASLRAMLRHCFENECLYFPVLWKGDKPIGAIANFMDVSRKSMLFYITGRDETFKNPPPGLVLHAYAIRDAIQNGFKVYDFLRGNEAYKFSFGAKERHIKHIVVKRKSGINQNRKLDLKTLPLALQLTAQQHRANRLAEAEQGYRQILEVQPLHSEALYGLGVLMKQKGEYQSAENLLRSLLQAQPNSTKVWFSLGNLHQDRGLLSEAVEAYHQVLALQPNSPAVYNNLGYTLQQQGKWEEAIACYQKALALRPECIEADVNWANALHAQGKLSSEKQAHYAEVNEDLGNKCKQAGDLKTAMAYYRQAIAMKPDLAEARANLELALQSNS